MKTKELKEIFYLFLIKNKYIIFSTHSKKINKMTKIKVLNDNYSLFKNIDFREVTKECLEVLIKLENDDKIINSNIFDNGEIYKLTSIGEKVLQKYNIINKKDLDNLILENLNIKINLLNKKLEKDNINDYNQILYFLKSTFEKTFYPKKRIVVTNSFTTNNEMLEYLLFNNFIKLKYRGMICSFENEIEKENCIRVLGYFSIIKPYNRESQYYQITKKGLEIIKRNIK